MLEIRLLGGFAARTGAGAKVTLATRKAEALLALLAVRPGDVFARDTLCGLLWPDVRDDQARHSLRQTLFYVRKGLAGDEAVLRSDSRRISLDPGRTRVDVSHLEERAAHGSREALAEAVRLWRGELLEGLSIGEQPFQEWLTFERERTRRTMIEALARLLALQDQAGDVAGAIQACAQLLQLDPWREAAHRALMRLHAQQGQRAAALEHYHALARALRVELEAEPEEATQLLYADLERAAPPTAAAAASLALEPAIGRAHELAALLAAAGNARACVTLLMGEAGAGKTHLCDRLAAELAARGVRVLRARCFESERVLPFSLWVNLFADAGLASDRALLDRLPRALRRELSALLPDLAQPGEPAPAVDVLRLFRAVQALIGELCEATPLQLILDDLQWADEMSLRLLCFLSRRSAGPQRCSVLGTVRQEDGASNPFLVAALVELEREQLQHRFELAPLSRDDSFALARQLAGQLQLATPSAVWLERVWEISEGNPLAIVETTHASAASGFGPELAALPIPERIRALIEQHVSRVSAPARELLAFAAVVGRELELDVLRQSGLPEPTLWRALEEVVDARLLQTRADRFYFAHDRMRETLYAGLLPVRRRWLHGQVACALERVHASQLEPVLGQLGYHYSKAGDAERAVRYLVRFAEQARRGHGMTEALGALEQALSDSERLPSCERARAAVEIVSLQAYCLAFLGRFAEIDRRLEQQREHVEQLGQPELAAGYHFWRGYSCAVMGRRREADWHARRAHELSSSLGDSSLMVAHVHFLLSYVCYAAARSREGVEHGQAATQLLESHAVTADVQVMALVLLAMNQLAVGDWQGARAANERARQIAEQADSDRGRSLVETHAAIIYVQLEAWERAREHLQRGGAHAKDPFTQVLVLFASGLLDAGKGGKSETLGVFEVLVTKLDEHGMRSFSGLARGTLAQLHLREGRLELAQRWAAECHAQALEIEDPALAALALRVRAGVLRARGELELARLQLDEALRLYEGCERPLELAPSLEDAAELAHAMRQPARAREYLQRAAALYASFSMDAGIERVRAALVA